MLLELTSAGSGKAVVLGAPVVLGGAPLGLELAVLLQPREGWEQRSRVDLEVVATERCQPLRDPIAVHRLAGEDRQDHQIQRSLRDIELLHAHSFRPTRGATMLAPLL